MPLQMPLKAAAFYVALHILLLVVLTGLVIRRRRSQLIGLGDGGDKLMMRLIRVHGNAAEQAAPNLALLILMGLLAAPVWSVHLFGFISLAGRVLHAFGLSQSAGGSLGRVSGMVLTLNCLIIGALDLIVLAFL